MISSCSIIGESSEWFWLMIQTFIIFGTLLFIYRQVRLQRFTNMLNTLTNMRNVWNGTKMLIYRQSTCKKYLDKTDEKKIGMVEGEVLGFFEELGLLLKKGAVSKEFIWETYSYFIENYWSMLKTNIMEYRDKTKDNSWYDNFEYLRDAMRKYSKKRKCPWQDKTEEEIMKFIKGELEE